MPWVLVGASDFSSTPIYNLKASVCVKAYTFRQNLTLNSPVPGSPGPGVWEEWLKHGDSRIKGTGARGVPELWRL